MSKWYYYLVKAELPETIINHVENERTFWLDALEISSETFTLAIDKIAGAMLNNLFTSGR